MMIEKNKKGQEESMGFVIIVLLLVVVGVVFLGFSLRKGSNISSQNQQELSDLTWAVLSYTTNCSVLGESQTVWDSARKCSRNSDQFCENGENLCFNLNSTIQDIFKKLKGSRESMGNRSVHAYEFVVSMENNKVLARQGDFGGNFVSYSTFIPGDINVTARYYYS